jgi:hypothetical protein
MAYMPPPLGGRKDLVDDVAGRQREGEAPEGVQTWERQRYERDVAQHPWRHKLLYWTLVAILVIVGLGTLAYAGLYFVVRGILPGG